MGLGINTNVSGVFASRQADRTLGRLTDNLEQLSSALRINRAADDAAGLAIAERFRSQVRQFHTEVNALQSGINAIDTAEGSLTSQQDAVGRLRELAVQAANETLTDEQRASINGEAQQVLQQIEQTAQETEFNGRRLLDGSNPQLTLETTGNTTVQFEESTVQSLGLSDVDLSTAQGAQEAVDALDEASERIASNRADLGAQSSRLENAIDVREESAENLQNAESRVRDLDLARATIERTRNELLLRTTFGALLQGNLVNQNAARLLGG